MRRVFLALAALMLLADARNASGQSVDFSSRELSLGDELQQVINSKRLQLGQPEHLNVMQSLTNEAQRVDGTYMLSPNAASWIYKRWFLDFSRRELSLGMS